LSIASGSLRELETHFLIAERLGYVPANRVSSLLANIDELAWIIYAMISKIKNQAIGTREEILIEE